MTRETADNRSPLPRITVAAALLALLAFLTWRAFYGLDWTDEPFYAAETWRITLGDAAFMSIWSSQQLSSIICSPLTAAYTGIVGGTDGILLFLRIGYLLACTITALLLYFSTRKTAGRLWAFLACVPVFAALSPAAFSYNTIQLLSFFSACAFLFAARQAGDNGRVAFLLLAGICCGTAFVAYPPTLIALPLICLWVLFEPSLGEKPNARARNLAPLAVGCLICLVFLIAYIAINSSFGAVFDNWQNIVSEKKQVRSPFNFLKSIAKAYGVVAAIALMATCVVAHVSTTVKDNRTKRVLRAVALVGAVAIVIWQYARVMGAFSVAQAQIQMYFAIASVGPILFLLNNHRWHPCIWMFLLGVIVSIAVYLGTSNGGSWYVYPGTMSASAVLLYCPTLARCSDGDEPLISRNVLKVIAGSAIAALLVAFAAFFTYVYRDAPLQELDTQLQSGPGAGLITTSERAELYYSMVDTVREYAPEEGTVLFLNVFPFGYLCTDVPPAAGNPFAPDVDSAKFARYYELNPDRIPSVIFFVSKDFEPRNGEVRLGAYLENYAKSHPYKTVKTDVATILLFDQAD